MHVDPQDFDEIRPYTDAEYALARDRLASHPALSAIAGKFFPQIGPEDFKRMLSSLPDVRKFQAAVISPAIQGLLARTSGGLTISGLERISAKSAHVYVSNHRDIVCDAALLTNALHLKGFDTPQVCLGDNLLASPMITDLVKMNKGVIVKRDLSSRELLRWSYVLSAWIRRSLSQAQSVWIAQREGRAKDGVDETHPGVIKMLTLDGEGEFIGRVRALRIVPVAISYELDPCDALKARELHAKATRGSYEKAPGEDSQSMALGIQGRKGRVHIGIGAELDLAQVATLGSRREQMDAIVALLDRAIHAEYRLWPTAYVALDELSGSGANADRYTAEERASFLARADKQLDSIGAAGDERAAIGRKLFESYANPVRASRAALA